MIDAVYQPAERRPLASRDLQIFHRAAAWLIARGVPANAVSLCSIVFAALASLCLVGTAWTHGGSVRLLFVLSALFVQARLLANLLDGMVAVGSGQASPIRGALQRSSGSRRRCAHPDRGGLCRRKHAGARVPRGDRRHLRRLRTSARRLGWRARAVHGPDGQAAAHGHDNGGVPLLRLRAGRVVRRARERRVGRPSTSRSRSSLPAACSPPFDVCTALRRN